MVRFSQILSEVRLSGDRTEKIKLYNLNKVRWMGKKLLGFKIPNSKGVNVEHFVEVEERNNSNYYFILLSSFFERKILEDFLNKKNIHYKVRSSPYGEEYAIRKYNFELPDKINEIKLSGDGSNKITAYTTPKNSAFDFTFEIDSPFQKRKITYSGSFSILPKDEAWIRTWTNSEEVILMRYLESKNIPYVKKISGVRAYLTISKNYIDLKTLNEIKLSGSDTRPVLIQDPEFSSWFAVKENENITFRVYYLEDEDGGVARITIDISDLSLYYNWLENNNIEYYMDKESESYKIYIPKISKQFKIILREIRLSNDNISKINIRRDTGEWGEFFTVYNTIINKNQFIIMKPKGNHILNKHKDIKKDHFYLIKNHVNDHEIEQFLKKHNIPFKNVLNSHTLEIPEIYININNEGLNEEIKSKSKLGSGTEHNVYASLFKNSLVYKVPQNKNAKQRLQHWAKMFKDNPDIFPRIEKIHDNYIAVEKLDTNKVKEELYKLEDYFILNGILDDEGLFQEVLVLFFTLLENSKYLQYVKSKILKEKNKELYSIFKRWMEFISKVKNYFGSYNNVDIHSENIGYNNKGELKLLDS